MQEFIRSAMQRFGMSESDATSGAGGLLAMIKDGASSAEFNALAEKVPGAEAALQAAESTKETPSSGGALGGMMKAASSLLGGKAETALGVAGLLEQTGLNADQAPDFVSMFVGFMKDKAGPDLVESVLGTVPQLKNLVS